MYGKVCKESKWSISSVKYAHQSFGERANQYNSHELEYSGRSSFIVDLLILQLGKQVHYVHCDLIPEWPEVSTAVPKKRTYSESEA